MKEARTFYLTTIPGLELASHLELCDKWERVSDFFSLPPYPEVFFYKGGLEFKAPIEAGFFLIPWLRIPNRVLLRLGNFPAADESELRRGLSSLPWDEVMQEGNSVALQFTSRSSKLSMTDQVERCLKSATQKLKPKLSREGLKIFVRLFRDQCQVSVDLMGELAYKRGEQKKTSIASLRDSTAAGLLQILLQDLPTAYQLVDPMCGAGTFLTEALQLHEPLRRDFVFQQFPIFKPVNVKMTESRRLPMTPEKVIGFDIHDKAVRLALNNGKSWGERYHCYQQDLFSPQSPKGLDSQLDTIVIVNPPWGQRLPAPSQDLLGFIHAKYNPMRLGLLMPAKWKIHPFPMEKVRDIPILNSGVENRFLVFAKKNY